MFLLICCKHAGIPWSADIVLNDTRVSDAGVYRCMVNNPPEAGDPGIGELALSILGIVLGGWRHAVVGVKGCF